MTAKTDTVADEARTLKIAKLDKLVAKLQLLKEGTNAYESLETQVMSLLYEIRFSKMVAAGREKVYSKTSLEVKDDYNSVIILTTFRECLKVYQPDGNEPFMKIFNGYLKNKHVKIVNFKENQGDLYKAKRNALISALQMLAKKYHQKYLVKENVNPFNKEAMFALLRSWNVSGEDQDSFKDLYSSNFVVPGDGVTETEECSVASTARDGQSKKDYEDHQYQEDTVALAFQQLYSKKKGLMTERLKPWLACYLAVKVANEYGVPVPVYLEPFVDSKFAVMYREAGMPEHYNATLGKYFHVKEDTARKRISDVKKHWAIS